jgi:hypothetical protein
VISSEGGEGRGDGWCGAVCSLHLQSTPHRHHHHRRHYRLPATRGLGGRLRAREIHHDLGNWEKVQKIWRKVSSSLTTTSRRGRGRGSHDNGRGEVEAMIYIATLVFILLQN